MSWWSGRFNSLWLASSRGIHQFYTYTNRIWCVTFVFCWNKMFAQIGVRSHCLDKNHLTRWVTRCWSLAMQYTLNQIYAYVDGVSSKALNGQLRDLVFSSVNERYIFQKGLAFRTTVSCLVIERYPPKYSQFHWFLDPLLDNSQHLL